MKLEKGVISSSQLTLLLAGATQGANLLVAFTDAVTKHDTWLVVLSGLVVSIPVILIYLALAQKFPGKNLIQINDIVYGPYLGKLVSALNIWFFYSIAALNLRFNSDFFVTYIYPETPIYVFMILFIFICAWAVRSGIEVIARISFLFVVVTTIIVLLTFVLLLKDMKFTNFLPVFEVPWKNFFQGTHIIMSIVYSQVVVYLMVIPYVNKIQQVKSSFWLGLIIGAVLILIVIVRDTAVLGITATIMTAPSFEAVRMIDIAKIITRLDVLVAIVLLLTIFLRFNVFYYAVALGIAQMFNLRSYLPLVLPIGIMIISLAVVVTDSTMELGYWSPNISPTYNLAFELIPVITFFIAKIRKLPKKQGGQSR